jgi:hypothetical protein
MMVCPLSSSFYPYTLLYLPTYTTEHKPSSALYINYQQSYYLCSIYDIILEWTVHTHVIICFCAATTDGAINY